MASSLTLGLLVSATTSAAQGALQSLGQSVHRLSGQVEGASREHARLGGEVARLRAFGRVPEDLAKRYDRLGKSIESAKLNLEGLARAQEKASSHRAAMGEMWGQALGVVGVAFGASSLVNAHGEILKAQGEIASLGIAETGIELITKAGREFSSAWAGTSTEAFISASYDIKSGVSTLGDMAVGEFTKIAALTAAATKSSTAEMTTLFAKGYGIYRGQFDAFGKTVVSGWKSLSAEERDVEFGKAFSAGISASVQAFRTDGSQMSQALSSLGASATAAGVAMSEQFAVLGALQRTMSGSEAATKYQAFLAAASTAGGKMGLDFIDQHTGMLKSLPDILDTINDHYGGVIDQAAKDEMRKAFGTKEAQDLIDVLLGQKEALRQGASEIDRAMQGGLDTTEDMARALQRGRGFELLGQQIRNLSASIGKALYPTAEAIAEVVGRLARGLTSLSERFPGVIGFVGKAAAALLAFKAASLAARAGYHLLGGSLWSSIARWRSIKASVQAASLAMQGGMGTPTSALAGGTGAVANLARTLREIANSGAPLKALRFQVSLLASSALTSGKAMGGALVSGIRLTGQAVLWLGRAMLLSPIGWIGIAIAGAALLIWKFWKPIRGFFVGMFQGLSSALKPVGDAMRTAFAPVAWVVKPVADALGQVWSWVKALLQPVEDTGGAAQSLGQKFGSAIGTIIRLVIGLPLRLAMLPLEFIKLGAQIIGGLLGGLKQGWESLKSGLSELAGNIVGSFKSLLGIRSPSRVFAGLGGMLGAGLAVGMKGSAGEVARAAGEMSKAATPNLPTVPLQALAGRSSGGGADAAAGAGRGGMNVTFAPVIHVGQGGGGVREQVKEAMSLSFAEFERLMSRYERDHARRSPA